ncbi:MAG: hypothetical protein NTU88_15680 [Armatimonadetes bacterium]|nr:hypothetical protein [Armatimonadota bacterium]
MRKILALSVTLFWGCMMYSLAVRHVIPEHRLSRSSLIEPEMLSGTGSGGTAKSGAPRG